MTTTPFDKTAAAAQLGALLDAAASPNGRVREAALAAMQGGPHAHDELRAVLVRLNDWVPQVRNAAHAALDRLLPQVTSVQLVGLVPEIERLRRGGRGSHAAVLARIEARLVDPARPETLAQVRRGVEMGDKPMAVFCFDVLLRHRHLDAQALAGLGLGCRHLPVARRAAQLLRTLPIPAVRESLAAVAMRSRHASVRMAALRALRTGPADAALSTDAIELAQQALFDRNGTVRAIALAMVGGASPEVLARAADVLGALGANPRLRAGALSLVGELGLPQGHDLVRAGLDDPLPAMRRVAYGAAFKLGVAPAEALVCRALADPASSVFKTAQRWAVRLGACPTAAELAPLMQGLDAEGWERVFRLMAMGNPWDRLATLLELPQALRRTRDERDRFTACAKAWLQDMQRCFLAPTPVQAQRIGDLLARRGPGVFDAVERHLTARLADFGLAAAV